MIAGGGLASPGTLVPGTVLVHTYEIRRLINAGGMGQVYEAVNRVTGDAVALKVIRPELLGDERLQAMFVREAGVLRRIRDEAIVAYEGMFQDEQGRGFLVMSYIGGPSLADRMREKPLSADEAEALLTRLATALETAHRAGICHRDLSPDNVLLPDGDLGRATIIDFGIAKLTDPAGGTLVGTDIAGKSGYMSPEQLGVVQTEVGPRSDIYSLALVIAAAVRGAPVDMGGSWAEVIDARRQVPRLDGVPPRLRERLERMLAPNPDDRPASMAEVLDTMTRPPKDTREARRSTVGAGRTAASRGKTGRLIGLAVAVLLIAGGGIGYLFLAPRPVQTPVTAPEPVRPDPPPVTLEAPETPQEPTPPEETTTAESPPEQTVPAPAVLDRVAALLESDFPCAQLRPSMSSEGRLLVTGVVPSDGDVARLRQALAGIEGIATFDLAVREHPDPVCAAAALARRTMLPASESLVLNKPDGIYREGESLVVHVTAAPGAPAHVYLAYLDVDGSVVHLRPNPLATETRLEPGATAQHGVPPEEEQPGVRYYRVSPPFGRSLLLLTASDQPLFEGLRPEVEPAAEYLAALERLASERPGAIRATWRDIVIEP